MYEAVTQTYSEMKITRKLRKWLSKAFSGLTICTAGQLCSE